MRFDVDVSEWSEAEEAEASEFLDLVEANDMNAVRARLEADSRWANFNNVEGQGLQQPLHRAMTPEMVELLVAHGAHVNARDEYSATPITLCCKEGDYELLPALLAAGADLTITDDIGARALLYASILHCERHYTAFQLLLKSGAPYDLPAALAQGDLQRVQQALREDPQLARTISGDAVLMALESDGSENPKVHENRAPILKLLLEHGLELPRQKVQRELRVGGTLKEQKPDVYSVFEEYLRSTEES